MPKSIKIILFISILAAVCGLFVFRSSPVSAPVISESHHESQVAAATTTAKFASVGQIHKDCEAESSNPKIFDCYRQIFTDYTKAKDARQTLFLLNNLSKLGGYASGNCHPLAHEIGHIAIRVYGTFLAAAPYFEQVCPSGSGYYHGLLEEYLFANPNYDTALKTVCGTLDNKNYLNWFQCVHGLGHGAMEHRNENVKLALFDCNSIDSQNFAREICMGGVIMEKSLNDAKLGYVVKYSPKDYPSYPCVELPDGTAVRLNVIENVYAYADVVPTDPTEPKIFAETALKGAIHFPCQT